MKSSKLKKLCAVVLAATLSTSLFIGCGDSSAKGCLLYTSDAADD